MMLMSLIVEGHVLALFAAVRRFLKGLGEGGHPRSAHRYETRHLHAILRFSKCEDGPSHNNVNRYRRQYESIRANE